jgi:hypothetical protein
MHIDTYFFAEFAQHLRERDPERAEKEFIEV